MAGAVGGWLDAYGYWAVLALVLIESLGIPVPGEITLITAGAFVGSTGRLSIAYVIAAAAVGAVAGAQAAYLLGREGLFRLVERRFRLDQGELGRAQRLMSRHGWLVVLGGRFVVVLRSLLGWLAGIEQMDWRLFLGANAAGAALWATGYGLLGFVAGTAAHHFADWGGLALGALALVAVGVGLLVRKKAAV